MPEEESVIRTISYYRVASLLIMVSFNLFQGFRDRKKLGSPFQHVSFPGSDLLEMIASDLSWNLIVANF